MSKKPWKPETRAKHNTRKPAAPFAPETVAPGAPPSLDSIAQPLPIFGGAQPGAAPAPAGAEAEKIFDETKIKSGMGKAFCSVTQGIGSVLNYLLRNSKFEIQVEPIEPELGDLWAEFAFPVLKLHMPDLEKNPHLVLVMMTGFIVSGKFKIKTKEVKVYGEPNRDGNPAPKENSEVVA